MSKFFGRAALKISEARRDLSRLVREVEQGGGAIPLGARGETKAVLVNAREYLALRDRAAGRSIGWDDLRLQLVGTWEDLEADLAAIRRTAARRFGAKRRVRGASR